MSRMFLNQVSSRELFTGAKTNAKEKRYSRSQSSENNSQCMYQNTQLDSQEQSQDAICSQQLSGEISGSESQGRRMFERFMTKRTNSETFRSTPANTSFNHGTGSYNPGISLPAKLQIKQNFQQQVLMNKSKAKERDEREMHCEIVSTVKECSDDIKGSIKLFQQNMEQASDSTNEKFTSMANSVFDILSENFEKIMRAMKERDEKRSKIHEMEKEMTMRDAKIEELKNMIERQQSEKEKHLLESLKSIINSHHQETTDKLERLGETAHHQTNCQKELLDSHIHQREIIESHHQQLHNVQSKRHEEIKQGIIRELQQLRQDLENHKQQLEDFYTNQLSTIQYKSMKEIQYYLSSGLDKQAQQTRDDSREISKYQISQVADICESQREANERFIRAELEQQTLLRRQENDQLAKQIEMITLNKLSEINESQVNSTVYIKEHITQDAISKNVQKQLHTNYIEDLAKLRKKLEPLRQDQQERDVEYSCRHQNLSDLKKNGYPIPSCENKLSGPEVSTSGLNIPSSSLPGRNCDLKLKNCNTRNFAFVSPGYRGDIWNAKSVFSKSNPSPVAAVLPQPQNIEQMSEVKNKQRRKRGRETYSFIQPLRRSVRLNKRESDTENDASDVSQNYDNGEMNNSEKENQNYRASEPYSNVFSRPQNNFGVCHPQNKAVNHMKDKIIASRENILNEHSETQKICVSMNSNYSSQDSKSKFCGNLLKHGTHENKFLVRPSTFSVSNHRKSTPNVTDSLPTQFLSGQTNKVKENVAPKNLNSNLRCTSSVYDFNESPAASTKLIKESRRIYGTSSNRNGSSDSSRGSSPSLSITKIMIKRKVKSHKRSPDFKTKQGSQQKQLLNQEMTDDLLSTPNMEDNSNTAKWDSQSVMSNYRRSGEKRKLFNFDLGHELMAIKKAFKV